MSKDIKFGFSSNKPKGSIEKNSIFESDDSENSSESDEMEEPLRYAYSTNKISQRLNIDKVVSSDPNIYKYDEIYDEISAGKKAAENKTTKVVVKTFTDTFKKSAQERNIRRQIAISNQVKREGDPENDQQYVSESYKKDKLEQLNYEMKLKHEKALDETNLTENGLFNLMMDGPKKNIVSQFHPNAEIKTVEKKLSDLNKSMKEKNSKDLKRKNEDDNKDKNSNMNKIVRNIRKYASSDEEPEEHVEQVDDKKIKLSVPVKKKEDIDVDIKPIETAQEVPVQFTNTTDEYIQETKREIEIREKAFAKVNKPDFSNLLSDKPRGTYDLELYKQKYLFRSKRKLAVIEED